MKKIFIVLGIFASMFFVSGCTSNGRARLWGGDMKIDLAPGEKLLEVTWKKNELWYLVEPADSNYIPKTKVFKESSRFGMIEGSVTFVEYKK